MGIRTGFKTGWLFLLLIISLSFLSCSKHENLITVLGALDVGMDLDRDYEIIDYQLIKEDIVKIKKIFAVCNNNIIKIQIVSGLSDEEALRYVDNQRYLVDNLFIKQKIPYPGPLTNILECPKEYMPKIEEEHKTDSLRVFYYLYANNRLTFGGCAEDILNYAAVSALIYCKEKKEVYKVEYFTPKENPTPEYKEIVKSFKCKK